MQQLFSNAVRALSAGQLDEAARWTKELRSAAPNHPEVLHLSGVVACERGDPQADEWLAKAASLAPANPDIPYNHGSALLKRGEPHAAIERFEACLKIAPSHSSAWLNQGNAWRDVGNAGKAAECYQRVLALDPNHVAARTNLGNVLLDNDPQAALDCFERAVSIQSDAAKARRGRGQALCSLGQTKAAIVDLRAAAAALPDDPATFAALGLATTRDLAFDEAIAAYRRVTELLPDDPDAWNDLGAAATSAGDLGLSESSFRRTLDLDPDHRLATENLAALLELANRPAEAIRIVDADRAWDSPALQMVRARCLIREKRCAEAAAGLNAHPPGDDQRLAKDWQFTMASAMDKLDDTQAAMRHFSAGNEISVRLWRDEGGDEDTFVDGLASIEAMQSQLVARHDPVDASQRSPKIPAKVPAFVLGFQRSGTTLIDTILGAHPNVTVMEELPVLSRVISEMDARFGRYPEKLPELSDEQLAELRNCYFAEAVRLADPPKGHLLVDKSPLHSVHIGLIRQLFPQAPIVFVLRHPMDVVLSCFMQDFTMNSFMTNYTSPAGVARVYDAVMRLWTDAAAALVPPAHTIRYEELVESPESHLRALAGHLSLDWDPALLSHQENAHSRGLINTPSYEQVTQPIYKSARHRYKRYLDHLHDIRPTMDRWVEHFGYQI